jgi:hypothetical protein
MLLFRVVSVVRNYRGDDERPTLYKSREGSARPSRSVTRGENDVILNLDKPETPRASFEKVKTSSQLPHGNM